MVIGTALGSAVGAQGEHTPGFAQKSCVMQPAPQALQLVDDNGSSHPLATFMSQSCQPTSQTRLQAPPWHALVALFGQTTQLAPQAPQWARLVDRFTHELSHTDVPPPQGAQEPAAQISFGPQTLPQPPQFAASQLSCASQPSPGKPLQSSRPEVHASEQVLLEQTRIVKGPPKGQELPHAPQFDALFDTSTHDDPQPSCPAGHATQLPELQISLPAQALPQLPQ
jgi:hypothetical protein